MTVPSGDFIFEMLSAIALASGLNPNLSSLGDLIGLSLNANIIESQNRWSLHIFRAAVVVSEGPSV